MSPKRPVLAALLALVAPGCALVQEVGQEIGLAPAEPDPTAVAEPDPTPEEPAHVVVQQLLVSFEGASRPGVTRSKEEAKRLADRVLAEARGGREFAELV